MLRPSAHVLAVLALASPAIADCENLPNPVTEFEDARLIIEYNATDQDIGVHGEFDANSWSELCLYDPSGTLILRVVPDGRLGELSLAQMFLESREPNVTEWDFDALKAAFAEGEYLARGRTHDGRGIAKSARFTTVVPVMPEIVAPAVAEDETMEVPGIPVADLTVAWKPVSASLDGRAIEIVSYQLIVTDDNFEAGDAFSRPIFSVHLAADATSFVVPAAFFAPATLYEIEVLAIEDSGNQTIGLGFVETDG